jgi:hypothetical protein
MASTEAAPETTRTLVVGLSDDFEIALGPR